MVQQIYAVKRYHTYRFVLSTFMALVCSGESGGGKGVTGKMDARRRQDRGVRLLSWCPGRGSSAFVFAHRWWYHNERESHWLNNMKLYMK